MSKIMQKWVAGKERGGAMVYSSGPGEVKTLFSGCDQLVCVWPNVARDDTAWHGADSALYTTQELD